MSSTVEEIVTDIDARMLALVPAYATHRDALKAGLFDAIATGIFGFGGGGGAVESVNNQTGEVILGAVDVGADPEGTAAGLVADHEAAADPHPAYALESSLGTAATKSVGTTAGTVAAGDDSRFTDARAPTGSAGGDLGGTFPNPTVSQARGLRETSGPTTIDIGDIADGQFLKRSGSTVVGATPPTGPDFRVNDYFAVVPRGAGWSAIGLLNATLTGLGSSGTLAWYGGGQPYREASASTTADGQVINGMQGESTRSLLAAANAVWAVEFKFRTPDTTIAYIGHAWFAVAEGSFLSDSAPGSLTSVNLIGIHFDNTGALTLATRANGGSISTASISGTVAAGTLYAVRIRLDGLTAYGALAPVSSTDNTIGAYGTEASLATTLPVSTTLLTPSSRITQSHTAPSAQKMWLGAVMGVFGS